MRLDLHVHTVASDGSWTPDQVARASAAGGLDVIAVADHDTTAGVEAAAAEGRRRKLHVIPAAELSTTREGRELHILGYFLDPTDEGLRAFEARARSLRRERMERMISRLREAGIEVSLDDVLAQAGPDHTVLGRPHLARAMVVRGVVATIPEAFDRYIGDEHPAFVPTSLAEPREAIEVIEGAGGVAVWAHPPEDLVEELLDEMTDVGLRGLEVYRPRARRDQVERLLGLARQRGLLVSGGSDWHDPDRNRALGDFWVGADEVADLLEAGGI